MSEHTTNTEINPSKWKDVILNKEPNQKVWQKSVGPDCGSICDVVYYEMCSHCSKENECHKDEVDHEKMLDCVLRKLVIKSDDRIEDMCKINNAIKEFEKLNFVKSVTMKNYKITSIYVNIKDDEWCDGEKSGIIYEMYYKLLKSLKYDTNVDIDINSGD